ncbi:hypothetical protein GPJ56_005766 [Histomonas meleagridis]|uniref:uncharacterized protein n=1 Tax=Histomonas meleagridis TaxID=135588 RepID=UPI00355A143F|nr:hypothetical protein GPJ56_005766 [Histomonas meleagridis]KAH0796166.1 hypothetical protein GO595_010059 [Histomonas meleagridis]
MRKKHNWRKRALDRLDDIRQIIQAHIPAEKLEDMYKFAEKFEPSQEEIEETPTLEPAPEIEHRHAAATQILTSTNSFLQVVHTKDVPFYLQIVVPNTPGTAATNPQQTYEIAVWERSLLQIFCSNDTGAIFFEYCDGSTPLIIDVFAAPTDDTTPLYWKAAFEDTVTEVGKIINLHSRSMKHIFPPNSAYIAVTFDEGGGIGKIWEGGPQEPREMAIDVVANMWKSSNETPPENLEEAIKSYEGWPK